MVRMRPVETDARQFVDASPLRLVLAVDGPGPEQKTTKYDDDRCPHPYAGPDVAEDDDSEHTENEKRD